MISHEAASDLLGAYALDAVDGEERLELEKHLATCPRCRSELDGLREVAGALGNSVEPLPEGLWSSIAARLPERSPDEEPPPMPRLGGESDTPFRSPAPRPGGARRATRSRFATVVALAIGAAAVAAVLGIGLVRADDKVSTLQSAAAHRPSTVAAAMATPGHRVVDLRTPSQEQLASFVVVPDGRGYLVSSQLPALPAGRTYQLWGMLHGRPISLGLLGRAPAQATFTVAGGVRPSALALTAEPAGGSVAPTGTILATGTV